MGIAGFGSATVNVAQKLLRRARRISKTRTIRTIRSARSAGEPEYKDSPHIAAVVQLFNKAENIVPIISNLIELGLDEIIVLDDGSHDGAIERLLPVMNGKNHFIIRSNDLFEVITYGRALRFTKAELVILLQDDDFPPHSRKWIDTVVEAFEADPKLVIVGGRDGLTLTVGEGETITHCSERVASWTEGVKYVESVNRAPMVMRRQEILGLGSIDVTFAPFQYDDMDLCLRAWKSGYHVGLYNADFVRDVGLGGMRTFNEEIVPAQARKNWRLICSRYEDDIREGTFNRLVSAAREKSLERTSVSDS